MPLHTLSSSSSSSVLFWLSELLLSSSRKLWNFCGILGGAGGASLFILYRKFHNFLDFYTAPPKFTHAPPKFTHFRSMSSGDILILVKWNLKFEILCPTSFVAQTSCHYQMVGSTGSRETQRSCQVNRWGGHWKGMSHWVFPVSKNRMWLMQFSQGVVQCQKRLADVLGPINREPSPHSLQFPGWIISKKILSKKN